jgi:hypothetical protein
MIPPKTANISQLVREINLAPGDAADWSSGASFRLFPGGTFDEGCAPL